MNFAVLFLDSELRVGSIALKGKSGKQNGKTKTDLR